MNAADKKLDSGREQVSKMENAIPLTGKKTGNVVVSWTGGKDGCYSCYKAMKEGYRVTHLLNFRNLRKRGSHEINPEIIRAQSEALGIPLMQRDFISYEEEFKSVISDLRAQGARIDGAVFGHIETHDRLVERICHDLDIDLLLPLWKQDSKKIITEMIDAGFEVIIVSARDGLVGREWLGRRIDGEFIGDLKRLNASIDPCGENGEFHTLVTDGPVFKKKIIITGSEPVLREGYWHLDVSGFTSVKK
jgi:diphthine-ammonia ligase